MRVEERELSPHEEPVSPDELKESSVYFSVNFIDREMLTPTMEALIYVGRDLEPGDQGQLIGNSIMVLVGPNGRVLGVAPGL